jgi:hypothetical protein
MNTPLYTTGNLKSAHYDNEWRVEIHDTERDGDNRLINLSTGLKLEYESQSDDRFTPIKGSKLTVPLLVENSEIEEFINNDLLNNDVEGESRYLIALYKNDELFWGGVILGDLCQRNDESFPYVFNMVATDGLARLKDYEFKLIANNNFGTNLGYYVWRCLQNTPFPYFIEPNAKLYSSSINWYDTAFGTITDTTDPLKLTQVNTWAFVDVATDSNKENKAISYYDVLEQILLLFHCRIILSDGYFRIVSLNLYDKGAIPNERIYDRENDFISGNAVNWSDTIDQETSWAASGQNIWQYFPAIRDISRKFPNEKSANLLKPNLNLSTSQSLGITLKGGSSLGFTANFILTYNTSFATTLQAQNIIVTGKFKLKVGSYYLKSDPATKQFSWTTNSADRFFLTYTIAFDPQKIYSGLFNQVITQFSVITPNIPSGTFTSNEIQLIEITTNPTGLFTSQVQSIARLYLQSPDKILESVVQNTTEFINSKDYTLPDARIGDGYNVNENATLWYYDETLNTKIPTGEWYVEFSSTYNPIGTLLLAEIMAAQVVPNPRYSGQIITDAPPHYRLQYQDKWYVMHGVSYDLIEDSYQGEWFQVYYNTNTFNVVVDNLPQVTDPVSIPEMINDLAQATEIVEFGKRALSDERNLCIITSNLSGTVSSIPVDYLFKSLKTLDKIIIAPSFGTNIVEFTVEANASVGATSITVAPVTLTEQIVKGSPVMSPLYSPVVDEFRVRGSYVMMDSLPTSDPHVYGQIYRDSSHQLRISNG